MGRRDFFQRSTLYDLYVERNALRWYFRLLATAGTWLIVAGYIVFTYAAAAHSNSHATQAISLIVVATAVLVIGHLLTLLIYLFVASLLFRLDVILLPILVSSSIGFFAILLQVGLHQHLAFSQALIYLPFLCSILDILVTASLSVWTYIRIQRVRALDNRRRVDRRSQYQDLSTPSWQPAPSSMDSASTKLLPDLPNDEMQRQQLERLLNQRNTDRAPSPDALSDTYRIDLPSPYIPSHERHLSVPIAPNNGKKRGRSHSEGRGAERSGWQLQNLRNLLPGGTGVTQPHVSSEVWKDPRERRREEIERGDYRFSYARTPASVYGGGPSANPLYMVPPPQPTPPQQSSVFRYA